MKTTLTTNRQIIQTLESRSDRSAWDKGVTRYAIDLVSECEEELTRDNCRTTLLNGAQDWEQYSYGGCALIYDCDIAEELCSPSELKKCRGGERNPNSRETWLDVQSRALSQAFTRIRRIAGNMERIPA